MRMLAKNVLERQGRKEKRFKNNLPSNEWVHSFLKRHKQKLTMRAAQNIKTTRAGVTKETVKDFFRNLDETLTDDNGERVSADCVYNYDETNLSDDPGTKKCVFRRGCKYPERVMNSTKSSTSVMFCGSAAGEVLPPYVVYKAEHLWSTWMEGGPPNTRYNRTRSGWFDLVTFTDWFEKILVPAVADKPGQKVVIGDNLSSHFSPASLDLAAKHNIKFVCLPANSTHLMQPLDVAFFAPLKREWRKILNDWKMSSHKASVTLTKESFPVLLSRLINNINKDGRASRNMKSGFEATGICPLDQERVLKRLPSDEGNTQAVSSAVMDLLSSRRHGEQRPHAKKRCRVNVEPGKSISREDLQEPGGSTSTPSTSRGPAVSPDSDMSEEDCEKVDGEEVNAPGNSDEPETACQLPDPMSAEPPHAAAGSFYIVRFMTKAKHKCKMYVAMCESAESDDSIQMNFMKKGSEESFFWPEKQDKAETYADQLVCRLSQPDIDRRGSLHFKSEELLPYKLMLG